MKNLWLIFAVSLFLLSTANKSQATQLSNSSTECTLFENDPPKCNKAKNHCNKDCCKNGAQKCDKTKCNHNTKTCDGVKKTSCCSKSDSDKKQCCTNQQKKHCCASDKQKKPVPQN